MSEKRIPEFNPFIEGGPSPTDAQRLLGMARSATEALKTADQALEEALRLLRSENVPAAAAQFGVAMQAVRDGVRRADWIEGQLHQAYGDVVDS